MANKLDARTAVVFFDLCFEEYNYNEDVEAAKNGDTEAAERLAHVMAYGSDLGYALHLAENKALSEIEAKLNRKVSDYGHDSYGHLICCVSVDTLEESKVVAEIVAKMTGGGDDCVYLEEPYFCAQGFILYPRGVNRPSFPLHELENAIEDGLISA